MWCYICNRETDEYCEEKCVNFPSDKLWDSEEIEAEEEEKNNG